MKGTFLEDSYPKTKNMEMLGCSIESCNNQTLVHQKSYVKSYTCPECWGMIIRKKNYK